MSSANEIRNNLRDVYKAFGSVVDRLVPEQWIAQSLCPAWTVQGVVQHVTTIEKALLGWRPGQDSPFNAVPAIAADLGAFDPPALAEEYRTVTAQRISELDAMSDEEFSVASLTPVGPGTYGRFMAIREFDIWVHERDIRVPLQMPGDDGGPAAVMALDEVHGSIGFIAGKKIGLPDGKSLAINVTGPEPRRIMVRVDGRAARVEELPAPDATLTCDLLTFMLLACGRVDPEGPIADGRITWEGDAGLGAHAARHLAFTM